MLQGGLDSAAMPADSPAEFHELGDPAAGCPFQPPVQGLGGGTGLAFDLEDCSYSAWSDRGW